MAIKQEETVESIFLKYPILLTVLGGKFIIPEMVVDDYRDIFYAVVLILKLLQRFFQHFYAHVNSDLVVAGMLERHPVLHNYIDRLNRFGEKFLPEIDLSLFLHREDETQHQRPN